MESKLINYSIFIEKRPDMEVHTEVAIVSCINSAYVLLDGECASLISQVDKFNMVEDRSSLDTTHELYRTDFELGQLQEALVFQVQYVLNMGNDFTVGGGSYSIGNINSSFSRPEGRELIAPGVYKLLSNARVYHLNAFGSFSSQNTNEIPLSTSKEIMERVKNEYVAQNQPNAQVGQVAYVNQSKQIDFGNPQDLQITTYNTNRIAGPEGYRNNFYEIDNVPNIAFFGPDYNGTYSAVHRQEMIDYVNQNAGESLGQEIAQIKQEQEEQNNKINLNKNLIDSTYEEAIGAVRKNAEQDETIRNQETRIESNWNNVNRLNQEVGTNKTNIQTNTNNITALDGRLLSVSGLLNQTIDGLRTLRPFKFVGLYDSSRTYMINEMVSKDDKFYLSLEDNNSTTPPGDKWIIMENFQQVDLSDYPTKLEVDSIKNDLQNKITANTTSITNLNNSVVKIDGEQTITGVKRFNNQVVITHGFTPLTLKPSAPGKTYMLIKGADDATNFSLGANSSNTSLEVNRGDLTIKTQQANKNIAFENAARIKFNRSVLEIGTEINAGFGGGEVKFIPEDNSTKTLKFYNNQQNDTRRFNLLIADPTQAQNPATKQYVDNAIANAAPTDLVNRIQSLETNTVKLTGDQRIEGTKTLTNTTILLGELINIGQTQSSLVNKKYVDDAIANAAGTGGAGLENRIQVLENKVDATYDEFIDLANTTIPRIDQTNQIQQNAIDSHDRKITQNTQNITNLQTLTTTNRDKITYLETNTVDTSTNQTINGTKTFAMKILANGGITNLPTPTNSQDAANKLYVDNKPLYQVFSSTTTIYNNLQSAVFDSPTISNSNNLKSWMIQFDRQGQNGNTYEGTFNLNFILPDINKATWVEANVYFNSNTRRFEGGARAGITIHRTSSSQLKLTFQLWDNGNRIKNVKVFAPAA